jgi:glycerophosphoryl diester phosphodiesterase
MKIIGHRGAKGLAPENTIAGFKKALEHHVDAIELDVRVTKDGKTVLLHDGKLIDRAGNKLIVADHTFDELQQHKPDLTGLEEAIACVNREVPLLIEVKPGVPVKQTIEIVERFLKKGWTFDDLQFISFSFPVLKQLRKAFPEATIIVDEMWSGVRASWRARRLGTRHVSMYLPFLWFGFIRSVSRSHYYLYAFPLNDAVKAHRWAKYGLHGVITDRPDLFE